MWVFVWGPKLAGKMDDDWAVWLAARLAARLAAALAEKRVGE